MTVIFQMYQTIHPKRFYLRIRSTDGTFETVYCWYVHLSFLTLHNLLFFSLCKTSKKQHFRFFCRFSRKIVQILIFKVEYFENGLADFNDFGLSLQDFQWPFKWNQLVLALQFFCKGKVIECRNSNHISSNGLKAVTDGNTWIENHQFRDKISQLTPLKCS